MTWIRNTSEPAERRPVDVAALALGAGGAVVLGLFAEAQTATDAQFAATVNGLTDELQGVAKVVFYGLGSIATVAVVAALLLLARRRSLAARVALSGGGAWAAAKLLNAVLPAHELATAHLHVRVGSGPVYPSVNVAVITATAIALSPNAVRPLRRLLVLAVVLEWVAAVYLGTAYGSDAWGGVFLGLAVGALVLVVLGSPAGRPTLDEVRNALASHGYDIADVRYSAERITAASVVDVTLRSGEVLRVDAFGRDQRDAQLASKVWHAAMYHEPGRPVFGSRIQQVEHIAYALLLADRAGVRAPKLVKTFVGDDKVAMLAVTPLTGRPLAELDADEVTDVVLERIWDEVCALHAAGLSHGNLDPLRIVVDAGDCVALADFSSADTTGETVWQDRDCASVLVVTSLVVGNARAVDAAVRALGKDRIAQVLPVIQPAALPPGTGRGVKHLGRTLKGLRDDVAAAAGVEDAPPLKIRRLTWTNVGMLAGVLLALAIAIPGLEGVDWASVAHEFDNALWGWALITALLWPLVPMAWATALMGCVTQDLPFFPTVLTQVACSFLNLITPNGIGGTALQIDYLHKQDVPIASAASAMVLSTGVGGALQMGLFLIAAAVTATAVDSNSSPPSASQILLVIAVVAALVGIVLWIPKVRGKIVPHVKRAASDIAAVTRNPKKAMRLFGGDLAGNLLYPLLLGLCLLAFHQRLDYAQLVVVQIGAGMLGNVAPVPGGIGVQEAALTAGLTSFGVPSNPALAAVILFRGITFAIPPVIGFFTLRWLRRTGYA